MLGGELLSGMSIDGVLNARGQYVVGGISDELFAECRAMGRLSRTALRLPADLLRLLRPRGDEDRHHAAARSLLVSGRSSTRSRTDVVMEGNRVTGLVVVNRSGRTLLEAEHFLDCSGRRGPGRDGGGAVRDRRRERAAPAPVDGLSAWQASRPIRSCDSSWTIPRTSRSARAPTPRREDRRGARAGSGTAGAALRLLQSRRSVPR